MNALAHTEVRELFSAYVDEDLPEPQRERLLEHVGVCDDCSASLERFEETVAAVRGLSRERAPASFSRQVMRRVKQRGRRQGALATVFGGPLHVPIEAAIPILLGAAAVAVLLYLLQ